MGFQSFCFVFEMLDLHYMLFVFLYKVNQKFQNPHIFILITFLKILQNPFYLKVMSIKFLKFLDSLGV